MIKSKPTILLACLGVALARNLSAADAPKADAWGITLPSSITEASLTTKIGWDSNVYCTESAPLANQKDIAEKGSTVFSASPKLLLNGVKLFDLAKGSAIQALSFGYTGEYNVYSSYSKEDNARHSLPFSLKLKNEAWSASIDNTFLYVNGSKGSPLYNTYSAYGTATARERRNQIQNRLAANVRYDCCPEAFLRIAGNSLTYDLLTNTYNTALAAQASRKGYQNWIDRSDIGAGVDAGYRINKDLSFVTGWRVGQQFQDRFSWGAKHVTSTFNRVTFGLEGKIASWLQGNISAGPDFRRYSDAPNLNITGASHTWLYVDGNLTATATPDDKLVFTTKVWHWVSSTGSTSYQDSSYVLSWKHIVDKNLTLSAGVKFAASKYDLIAPPLRNDQMWTLPVGVSYAFSKEVVLSADYQFGKTHNVVESVTTLGRDYQQHQFSVSLKLAL